MFVFCVFPIFPQPVKIFSDTFGFGIFVLMDIATIQLRVCYAHYLIILITITCINMCCLYLDDLRKQFIDPEDYSLEIALCTLSLTNYETIKIYFSVVFCSSKIANF